MIGGFLERLGAENEDGLGNTGHQVYGYKGLAVCVKFRETRDFAGLISFPEHGGYRSETVIH